MKIARFLTMFFCFFIIVVCINGQEIPQNRFIAFDFSADQSNRPYPNYGAAYIINISQMSLTFHIFDIGGITVFNHFWMCQNGISVGLAEMLLAETIYDEFLILKPGDKVLAYSAAFGINLEQFPDAIFETIVFINNHSITKI